MKRKNFSVACFFIILFISFAYAQGKKPVGLPPAVVAVSELKAGTLAPDAEFVGTIQAPVRSSTEASVALFSGVSFFQPSSRSSSFLRC
jgi:hypothetical protein